MTELEACIRGGTCFDKVWQFVTACHSLAGLALAQEYTALVREIHREVQRAKSPRPGIRFCLETGTASRGRHSGTRQ